MALKRKKTDCPDCGVEPGQLHVKGCDVEQCAKCGGQRLSCGCRFRRGDERLPWTGLWPGVLECREYGLFCKRALVRGYIPCHPDDRDAGEDLGRLVTEGRWDREKRRFFMA